MNDICITAVPLHIVDCYLNVFLEPDFISVNRLLLNTVKSTHSRTCMHMSMKLKCNGRHYYLLTIKSLQL